ncbi:hypothetical protein [Kistimonas asteriae]|uniref:hypothetical protein n=1 Tax=Kistimonas asteriae TaxID=517724 RepID=UPI001BA879D6|nr:hypothetical protein [Kistimonas asteriae]
MARIDGTSGNQPVRPQDEIAPGQIERTTVSAGNLGQGLSFGQVSENSVGGGVRQDGGRLVLAPPTSTDVSYLGTLSPDQLESLLNGLKAEKEDLEIKNQVEILEDLKARKEEKSAQKTVELLERLDGAQEDKSCGVVKAVFGALLGPIGIPLMVSGIQQAESAKHRLDIVNTEIKHYYQERYGEEGSVAIEKFQDDYERAFSPRVSPHGIPLKDTEAKKLELKAQADELMASGVISETVHNDLIKVIDRKAHSQDVAAVFLHDAVLHSAGYESSDEASSEAASPVEGNEAMSPAAFQKWFAQFVRDTEAEEKMMADIQKQIEEAKYAVLTGATDQRAILSGQAKHI